MSILVVMVIFVVTVPITVVITIPVSVIVPVVIISEISSLEGEAAAQFHCARL